MRGALWSDGGLVAPMLLAVLCRVLTPQFGYAPPSPPQGPSAHFCLERGGGVDSQPQKSPSPPASPAVRFVVLLHTCCPLVGGRCVCMRMLWSG